MAEKELTGCDEQKKGYSVSTAKENALFFFFFPFKWPFLLTLCGLAPVGMVSLLLVMGTGCLKEMDPEMKGCLGGRPVAPAVGRGESKAGKAPSEESPVKGWLQTGGLEQLPAARRETQRPCCCLQVSCWRFLLQAVQGKEAKESCGLAEA